MVTGGDPAGTNGTDPAGAFARGWAFLRRHVAVLLALAAGGLLTVLVNVGSTSHDRAEAGIASEAWEYWLWEGSSFLVWSLAIPFIGALALRLAARPWWQQLVVHVPALAAASAVHIAGMVALRSAGYAAAGSRYVFDWGMDNLLYEVRKDALSYAIIVVAFRVSARLFAVAPSATATPAAAHAATTPFRLEVRDAGRTHWLAAADIISAEAAGNYVELHTVHGALLHRATLATLAALLAPHGFVRVHRGRLVRRDAVRAITARSSGDFDIELADGRRLGGSRRYRAGLGSPANGAAEPPGRG